MFLLQSSEMSVTFWGARVKISKWLVLVAISTAQRAWETQKVSCGPKDSHQRAWDWIVIQSLEPVEIALRLPVVLSTYLIGRCVAMFCLWGFQVSLPKKVMPTPKILWFWCFGFVFVLADGAKYLNFTGASSLASWCLRCTTRVVSAWSLFVFDEFPTDAGRGNLKLNGVDSRWFTDVDSVTAHLDLCSYLYHLVI